jgi:hypothetical protein
VWLFFDQVFLPDQEPALSTFLLLAKTASFKLIQPVDKSVTKLWKDSAEGRRYWLGAIVGLPGRSCKMPWATRWALQGQAKNFLSCSQSLVGSGSRCFGLAPKDCGPACG